MRTGEVRSDIPVIVAAILAIVGSVITVAPASAADMTWYRSNEDFMELDPLERGPTEGWSLAVHAGDPDDDETDDDETEGAARTETRSLYFGDELRGRELVRYSRQGDPLEIRRLGPVSDDEGERSDEVFRIDIRYRPDRTIRSVHRCEDGGCIVVRYAPPGAAGLETIHGPELNLDIRYGPTGRPEYVRRERPGEPVEEEWYDYEQQNLRTSRAVKGDEEIFRRYTGGLPTLEETRRDGRVVSRVIMDRAPDGTLLRRTTETRNRVETERFFPETHPGIVRERRVNGELLEQEESLPDGGRVITRLRDGEIVVRTWYDDDRAIRREIYQDGEIVGVEEPEE